MCGRVNGRKTRTTRIMENLWLCVPRTGRFRCFQKQDVNETKNHVLFVLNRIQIETDYKHPPLFVLKLSTQIGGSFLEIPGNI